VILCHSATPNIDLRSESQFIKDSLGLTQTAKTSPAPPTLQFGVNPGGRRGSEAWTGDPVSGGGGWTGLGPTTHSTAVSPRRGLPGAVGC